MTTSSDPLNYSSSLINTNITLSQSQLEALRNIQTITVSSAGSGYTTGSAFTTMSTGSGGIGPIGTTFTYKWPDQQEFVNCFPDWGRMQKMCEEYPGLKIAFEKFKTTYYLVKDHYDTPEDKRPPA